MAHRADARRLKRLGRLRSRALKLYQKACDRYYYALKATDDEVQVAAGHLAVTLEEYKVQDFVDTTVNWTHWLSDEIQEVRRDVAARQAEEKRAGQHLALKR